MNEQYTLEQLFDEARAYGKVYVHTSDSGAYSVTITFYTKEHVQLEAKSGFGHVKIDGAFIAAIKNAKEIVASIGELKEKIHSGVNKITSGTYGAIT